eukprot:4392676-Pleurochrysis_carterae.AAC.1
MAMGAFAAGEAHAFEGFGALQPPNSGIGAYMASAEAKAPATGARHAMCDYPLSTYATLASVISVASQPLTHACVARAFQQMMTRFSNIRNGLAPTMEARRNLPPGVATCGLLFLIVAFLSYGDAALADRVANVCTAYETQTAHTVIMQSMPATAPPCAKSMWQGDTGAGMHCVTSVFLAIAGSLRENTTMIVTANGTKRPKHRCSVGLPLRTSEGGVEYLRLHDVLVLDNASHNLVSLGRLAKEAHVGVHVKGMTGDATLTLPSGATAPLIKAGVQTIPTAATSTLVSPAVVTHGNRKPTKGGQMTAELLHATCNHRRAEVLRLLPQCTRDAPTEWTSIARNIACDECLRANSDTIHSTSQAPTAKAASDIVSYDLYYT